MSRARRRRAAAAALLLGLAGFAAPSHAQYANDDRADWREDTVPPPPAYQPITLNPQSGIVRYVVVARGPSAVNAFYEGIRCATGEYRVYARQVQGGDWAPSEDEGWKPMRGQSSVMVQHPGRLAQGGLCVGTSVQQSVTQAVRELRSGNKSLYY